VNLTPFRWRDAAVEALKNLRATPWQSALIAGISFLIAFAALSLTVSDVGNIHTTYQSEIKMGRFVFLVSPAAGSTITVSSCDALNQVAGVAAAGSVVQDMSATTYGKTTPLRVLLVTSGYAKIAWPWIKTSAVPTNIAPPDFVARFGIRTGGHFTYTAGGVVQRGTVSYTPTEVSRLVGINDALVRVVAPQGSTSQCTVSAVPAAYPQVGATLRGWFGPGTIISDYLTNASSEPDVQQMYDRRVSNFGWAFGGLLLVALLTITWFAKRNDFSLYRILGFKERHVVVLLLVDLVGLVLLPVQIAALVCLGLASSNGQLTVIAVEADWARMLVLTLVAPAITLGLVRRSSSVSYIKGR
jgi:hypothetical protein